ncbi:MAG TPA: hypothetical protein PKJ93_10065, partial [Methanoculleus sp.]|nr:hypothetical protein [Methanoculleus sp.]
MQQALPDITRTRSLITDYDVYLFRQGSHSRLYDRLGSHPAVIDDRRGTFFAVWAPNARAVSGTIAAAETILGMDFHAEDEALLANGLNNRLRTFQQLRQTPVPLDT